MDFESPDVEKDFPGLYASESGRKSNESDFSEGGEHEKGGKKDLLGRRKEKKEKKDRGYAALEGESSPEEDTDNVGPSKSKKTKSFKFPTKSKEKREKSRDKEKVLEDAAKKELSEKERKKEKEREKKEKEKREKLKEKDKEKEEKAKFKLESKEKLKDEKKDKVKDKDKEKVKEKEKEKVKEKEKDKGKEKEKEKVKEKEKDKKDKKLIRLPSTVTAGVPFEEIFTLGVALPIFGVPLQLSVERMRCHDDTSLPLVVRDSIDYLQAHGIKSGQIYRAEADKMKLQQLYKLYTERGATFPYHWDVPIACAMLKIYLSELPESILTQELHGQFEQATAIAPPQREVTMCQLVNKLPACNHSLLGWLVRHYESVLVHAQINHATVQSISGYMGAALNMSQTLLTYLITNAEKLFPDVRLAKYIPPLLTIPADFPETANEIAEELRKQESLLNQIHLEMHAGFITPARDQQLWEAQRIVTQLKRKLRAVQKSVEPNSLPSAQASIDEPPQQQNEEETKPPPQKVETPPQKIEPPPQKIEPPPQKIEPPPQKIEPPPQKIEPPPQKIETPPQPFEREAKEPQIADEPFPVDLRYTPKGQDVFAAEFEDNFNEIKSENANEAELPIQVLPEPQYRPKLSERELQKLRLELENAEYLQLKSLLQAKINSEQFEIVKLRSQVALKNKQEATLNSAKELRDTNSPEEQELRQKLIKEIGLLEQRRLNLINQIFQERVNCIQLKIELAMKELHCGN